MDRTQIQQVIADISEVLNKQEKRIRALATHKVDSNTVPDLLDIQAPANELLRALMTQLQSEIS